MGYRDVRRPKNRPFIKQSRRRGNTSVATHDSASNPVFEALEPRKLLTTLISNPDPLDPTQTDTFTGFIAMPAWYTGQNLTADTVEERSVRVRITISDPTGAQATVNILDLAGEALYPWLGQADGSTSITVSTATGDFQAMDDDGFWGTDDDLTEDVFGLDSGYTPGWRSLPNPDNFFAIDGVYFVRDSLFNPVRVYDWDEENNEWTPDQDPFSIDFTNVIPGTAPWFIGDDDIWETEDDLRVPEEILPVDINDDRRLNTGDDPMPFLTPFQDPSNGDENLAWHLVDRMMDGRLANDGIADFNNGIGQIIFSNTTSSTRLSIQVIDENGDIVLPFAVPEDSRVGVAVDLDGTVIQMPFMGSVIIGNPTNADWTVHDPVMNFPDFLPDGFQNYKFKESSSFPDRLREGIFFDNAGISGNLTVGRIAIDGALFGVSEFPGSLEFMNIGYLGGALIVDGEFDSLIVAGSSGFIDFVLQPDSDTGAFLRAGRNLGSVITGDVMGAEVFVDGDFEEIEDKPFLRADGSVVEIERVVHQAPDLETIYNAPFRFGNVAFWAQNDAVTYYSNDTMGTAQFVGRATGQTTVFAQLGGGELEGIHSTAPLSSAPGLSASGDVLDFFTIAVEKGAPITVQALDAFGQDFAASVSLMDETGRILASRGLDGSVGPITYTPEYTGLIWIHVEDTIGLAPDIPPTDYSLEIIGIKPVTLGEIQSLGSFAFSSVGASISTQFGSIGSLRAGQDLGEDDAGGINSMTVTSEGSIWSILSGGSIADSASVSLSATNHIGQILAGYGRTPGGVGDTELASGDIALFSASAGGSIGRVIARGGNIGGTDDGAATLNIVSGGDIGHIRADDRIYGKSVPTNNASPGSRFVIGDGGVIDLIEAAGQIFDPVDGVSNRDLTIAVGDGGITNSELVIETGSGGQGNVRFVRAPHIYSNGFADASLTVAAGEKISLVDDTGAVFTVEVTLGASTGGLGNPGFATILTQPVRNSRGVSVARISAVLNTGADLIITNNSGQVEIGDVIVTSFTTAPSGQNIIFNGSGTTDVYLVRATGSFDSIENKTGGDMIAIDIQAVDDVKIAGNLGYTHTTSLGPKWLGPDLGLTLGEPGGSLPGEPLEVSAQGQSGAIDGSDISFVGAPFDRYLNGLVVRSPLQADSVSLVQVDGRIQDVIVQNTIDRVIANKDGTTAFGEFDGITGVIYAYGNIGRVDVGDGLRGGPDGPRLMGGIIALGQVERVVATGEDVVISGWINGGGIGVFSPNVQNVDYGIGRVDAVKGASIIDATISTNLWDDYWQRDGGGNSMRADINQIRIKQGGDLIDSRIRAVNLEKVEVKGGIWDSNIIRTRDDIGRVGADSFVTTSDDLFISLIEASGNIDRIETWGGRGDIRDILVDIQGNLGRFRGNDIEGVRLEIDETLERVDAKGRIARSQFTSGAVSRFNAVNDIARVTIDTAGPISQFRSKSGAITRLDLLVDGPDGRLDKLEASQEITGEIRVSGPIQRIKSSNSDIDAVIETFSGDGDVKEISAGRDILSALDIDGNLDKLSAGRDIGDGRRINISGDLKDLDASKGNLNASVNIEGHQTGKIVAATVSNGSSIRVQGSIKLIDLNSGSNIQIISDSGSIDNLQIDGSLLAGGVIKAFDGGIDSALINGDMSGEIFADEIIESIDIRGDLNGSIRGRTNIEEVRISGDATNGVVHAFHDLEMVDINGSITNTVIGAGENLLHADIGGNATGSYFLAGLDTLGTDLAVGGTGQAADTFSSGVLTHVHVRGGIDSTTFAAGVAGGSDGDYSTLDGNTDLAGGVSKIETIIVDGADTNGNVIVTDTTAGSVSVNGTSRTINDPPTAGLTISRLDADDPTVTGGVDFMSGASQSITQADGDIVTFTLVGAGTGTFAVDGNNAITDLIFLDTTRNSNLSVTVTGGTGDGLVDFEDVRIEGADDANLSSLTIGGHLDGAADVSIDGNVNTVTGRNLSTTGGFSIGGNTNRFTFSSVTNGEIQIGKVDTVQINGNFSGQSDADTASFFAETIEEFNVSGDVFFAAISGRDYFGSLDVDGGFGLDFGVDNRPAFASTRGDFDEFHAATTNLAAISAGDTLGKVDIDGDATDTDILAGFSLGADGDYGGGGDDNDLLTDGTVADVSVGGNFIRSNVAAGVSPGVGNFFGDGDDLGALGLSEIQNVHIGGDAIGSQFFSESYAFTASGKVERVLTDNGEFPEFDQNMRRREVSTTAIPVEVEKVKLVLEVDTYIVQITFNQDIDTATVLNNDPNNIGADSAISFHYVDGAIDVPDNDLDISYDEDTRVVSVEFDRGFTNDNPGIYALEIDGSILRSNAGLGLDADGDGVPGDNFDSVFLIGDAGDRSDAGTWDVLDDGPGADDVEFREAADLNTLLGGKNNEIVVVGQVGDHPDHDPLNFPERMDVDAFKVDLEAGDIFRASLEELAGSGFIGAMQLYIDDPFAGLVPVATEAALGAGLLIEATQSYWVVITGLSLQPINLVAPGDNSGVNDLFGNPISPDAVINDVGRYELHVMIHDDGDTGFDRAQNADLIDGQAKKLRSDIGRSGSVGVPETTFNDADVWDITRVRVGAGADGVFGTGDDDVLTELAEGTTVTITALVDETGANLGFAAELGLFNTTESSALHDGLLVGAPGFEEGGFNDLSFTVQIPEDGTYAVYIQGNIETNYTLELTVDTSTAGARVLPTHQNILLETNGGVADWYGRFGTELSAFGLDNLGFEEREDEILSLIIAEVQDDFENAGIDVNIQLNSSQFGDEEFTTVFLVSNFGEENDYGLTYGVAETLDPLNQDQSEEAIVFVNSFVGLAGPGQFEGIASAIADVVSHELGHTMGLRHNITPDFPFGPPSMMDSSIPPNFDHIFRPEDGDSNQFRLADAFMLGIEDEVELLNWAFA